GDAQPNELEARVIALDPDVILEQRDGDHEFSRAPSVALVDDPREAWAHASTGDERGPHAILARDASPGEIAAALIAVAGGLVAVQPRSLGGIAIGTTARHDNDHLTTREIDVLGELARGVANKAIATRLGISEHTVKFHVASIFAKLAVSSRTEAVTQGVRLGLIML
ncbi:MAG: response regulator transcription factor, partial [Candidatus Eremiobacteraeota bacterium]|nr:response regulator transcription factor [Candidatus Eremiobacteraeota bacterium]